MMNSPTGNCPAKPEAIKPDPDAAKNEYVCVHCSVSHKNQEDLLEHLQTCMTNNNNTTSPCDGTNQGTDNISTPGKQSHMCMECGEVLSTPYSLKRHTLTHSGQKPHKCEFCDKRYKHAYLLNHHLNTHAGDRPFHCTECDKHFSSPNMLRRHKQVHTKQRHQCHHCEQRFQRIDYLDKHLANDHNVSRVHLCMLCGKSFTFETMLQEHIAMHNRYADTPEEDLKCNLCNNKFSRVSSLNRHKKQIHGSKMEDSDTLEESPYFKRAENSQTVDTAESNDQNGYCNDTETPKKDTVVFCSLCGQSFARADSLKRHLIAVHENVKTDDVPYEPVISFPESKAVIQNHAEESKHPCAQCGMEFTTSDLLQMHKGVVHPAENKLEAELLHAIQEKMSKEKTKKTHNADGVNICFTPQCKTSQVTVKTQVGTIYCASCKTHFADNKSYENHLPICMSSSTTESENQQKRANEPVNLNVCKKNLSKQPKLSAVSKPRKGRQKCEECGKYFADNYCLRRHMISHTGEKKHECVTCGKKFAHSFHLTSHNKIHLGIKDHRCDVCGKTFTVKHALQRHLLTHPSTVVYPCIYCQRKFANEASMHKHQLIHHQ